MFSTCGKKYGGGKLQNRRWKIREYGWWRKALDRKKGTEMKKRSSSTGKKEVSVLLWVPKTIEKKVEGGGDTMRLVNYNKTRELNGAADGKSQ